MFYRQASNNPDFEIAAINDLADKDNLLYLLEHDSVYGRFALPEKIKDIKFLQEKKPGQTAVERFGYRCGCGIHRIFLILMIKPKPIWTPAPKSGYYRAG